MPQFVNHSLEQLPSIAASRKEMREAGGQSDTFRQQCLGLLQLLGHTVSVDKKNRC